MADPTIGLALGGGGARGFAHIHVLEALDDMGLKPCVMSGTSIGAVMGAGYAGPMNGAEIRDYVLSTFTNSKEVIARFWRMRPGSVSDIFGGSRTVLGNIDPERALRAFLPEQVPATFEELAIPFQVVSTDFYGQKTAVFSEGDLVQAVAASAALPAIFKPVMRDDVAYVDGGLQNALPYELLFDHCDIVVAVDVVGGPLRKSRPTPSRLESLFGSSQLMMQATTQLKCRMQPPHAMIVPPVSGIGVMDFLKARRILEDTDPTYDLARCAIENALEAHVRGGEQLAAE